MKEKEEKKISSEKKQPIYPIQAMMVRKFRDPYSLITDKREIYGGMKIKMPTLKNPVRLKTLANCPDWSGTLVVLYLTGIFIQKDNHSKN